MAFSLGRDLTLYAENAWLMRERTAFRGVGSFSFYMRNLNDYIREPDLEQGIIECGKIPHVYRG